MKKRLRNLELDKKIPRHSCISTSDCTESFRPMSYYLNGGVDLDGELADNSAQVEYDNEEQLKELEQAGACAVPLGDPRESLFTITERAGVKAAQSAMDSAKAGEGMNE